MAGLLFLAFFVGCIYFIVLIIKTIFGPVKFKFKTFFLNGYINHNEITKISRGECILKFENGKFCIIQGNNTIEDNSSDIHNMRIWEYKNGLYLAINMKTHSEYKFSLLSPDKNNSELSSSVIYKLFDNLAKRLKVEFVECDESSDYEEE